MRSLPIPTSEPSKATLKAVPSKKTMSSFAALTPPTVAAERSERLSADGFSVTSVTVTDSVMKGRYLTVEEIEAIIDEERDAAAGL
jgi:hypothetical protein